MINADCIRTAAFILMETQSECPYLVNLLSDLSQSKGASFFTQELLSFQKKSNRSLTIHPNPLRSFNCKIKIIQPQSRPIATLEDIISLNKYFQLLDQNLEIETRFNDAPVPQAYNINPIYLLPLEPLGPLLIFLLYLVQRKSVALCPLTTS
jgi:hypothetical protein